MTFPLFLAWLAIGAFVGGTLAAGLWIESRLTTLEKQMAQRVELYLRAEVLNVQGNIVKGGKAP